MLKRQAASMKREEFADVVRRLSLESTSTMEERDTLPGSEASIYNQYPTCGVRVAQTV